MRHILAPQGIFFPQLKHFYIFRISPKKKKTWYGYSLEVTKVLLMCTHNVLWRNKKNITLITPFTLRYDILSGNMNFNKTSYQLIFQLLISICFIFFHLCLFLLRSNTLFLVVVELCVLFRLQHLRFGFVIFFFQFPRPKFKSRKSPETRDFWVKDICGKYFLHCKLLKTAAVYVSYKNSLFLILFVWFGLNVAFNNLSVISRRCLDVAGSSMLTFRVLPHWNIMPQTLWHDIPPSHIILTLSWPVLIPSSTFLMLSAKRKSS